MHLMVLTADARWITISLPGEGFWSFTGGQVGVYAATALLRNLACLQVRRPRNQVIGFRVNPRMSFSVCPLPSRLTTHCVGGCAGLDRSFQTEGLLPSDRR